MPASEADVAVDIFSLVGRLLSEGLLPVLAFCLTEFSRRARASPKARRWLLTVPAEGWASPAAVGHGTWLVVVIVVLKDL